MLDNVKHILLVLSGKGGVGKSTVSTQLALTLQQRGHKVGILDVDLCGPSVPYLLGLEDKDVHQSPNGWLPVATDQTQTLTVMSIGFLLKNRNDAVIWRGPKKTALIKQFFTDVVWQDRDYLIIDTPPGTSDEHLTVMECLKSSVTCDGAVIVTTPQEVAIDDVRREITFCKKTGIPIVGVIENLSGFVCPTCTECTNIFSSEGGKLLAELAEVPFLGTIPIDPRLGETTNEAYVKLVPDSPVASVLNHIVDKIVNHQRV